MLEAARFQLRPHALRVLEIYASVARFDPPDARNPRLDSERLDVVSRPVCHRTQQLIVLSAGYLQVPGSRIRKAA